MRRQSDARMLFVHPTRSPSYQISVPKGVANPGEDLFDAALRELFEETGIDVRKYAYKTKEVDGTIRYRHGKKCLKAYVLEVDDVDSDFSDQVLQCTSFFESDGSGPGIPEVDGFVWLDPTDLEGYTLHDTQSYVLNSYVLNEG